MIGRNQTYRAVIDHPLVKPGSDYRGSIQLPDLKAIRALVGPDVHDARYAAQQGLPGTARDQRGRWFGGRQLCASPDAQADPEANAKADPETERQRRRVAHADAGGKPVGRALTRANAVLTRC